MTAMSTDIKSIAKTVARKSRPKPSRRFDLARRDRAAANVGIVEHLEDRLLMSATSGTVIWSVNDGGNGNGYEVIMVDDGISWQDARDAADAAGGHLATLTSQGENDFVFNLINDELWWNELNVLGQQAIGPWIGGFKTTNTLNGWQWVTGEEWNYENWDTGEPNRSDQDYVHFIARGSEIDDVWNNRVANNNRDPVIAYIIEFEGAEGSVDVNEEPTIDSAPVENATEGAAYEYMIHSTDPDGDALFIDATTLPDWLTFTDNGDGTATLSGMPVYGDVGAHDVVIEVTDGEFTVQQSFTIDVAAKGQVSGSVWHDANENGVWDDGEQAMSQWRVYVDENGNSEFDEGELTTLTDDEGAYHFHSLDDGDHTIRVDMPEAEMPLDQLQLEAHGFAGWFYVVSDTVSFADSDHFMQTTADDGSTLVHFEAGDDDCFDELVMKVTMNDDGSMNIEQQSRSFLGVFHINDADGDRLMSNFGRGVFSQGGSVNVSANSYAFTTPPQVSHTVTVGVGDVMTGIDFGVYEGQIDAQPENDDRPQWLRRFTVIFEHFAGRVADHQDRWRDSRSDDGHDNDRDDDDNRSDRYRHHRGRGCNHVKILRKC